MAILVTGGTKGIGLDIAKAFAQPGEAGFLNYHADEAAAQRASQAITALGAHVHLLRADVGTPEGCAAMAAEVRRHAGGCMRLIVCGGGALNAQLMTRLQALLPGLEVVSSALAGLPPLQVEAAAFAWLACRALRGETGSLQSVTGARGARVLGAIYPA